MIVGRKKPVGPVAIIVMGVSGCGKSSVGEGLASFFGFDFIEGDSLHPPENVARMASGTPLADEDRWPWLDRIGAMMAASLTESKSIVISCSALKKTYRDRLRMAAGGRLHFLFLNGSPALLAARMRRRKGHFMPPSLLESQLATLEDPGGEVGVMTVSIEGSKDEAAEAARAALRSVLEGA